MAGPSPGRPETSLANPLPQENVGIPPTRRLLRPETRASSGGAGREVADRIVLESHFQLDGFATMAKGARAILDADRHLFRGAHLRKLRNVFAVRGIGPV